MVAFRDAERRLWESVGATPTERRVHLRQCDATVRIQEVGAGPPVLFVHGASNAGSSWASLAVRLDGFHCLLLDRPGCGLSDPIAMPRPDVAAIERYADSLIPEVLDATGIDRASLISTSYGGYFALRAAAHRPDRIDHIVELGSTFGAPMAKVPFAMRITSVPLVGRLTARVPPNERAVRMILRQIGLGQALDSGRFTQTMLDWFVALLRDTKTMRNELRATPRIIRPLHGLDERVLLTDRLLARIESPVRFVWGEEDPNGGAEIARAFAARLPRSDLELMPGVGHAPWIDEPDHVADATRRFLASG